MQAGTYDFVAAPTTVTKERAESMLFTEGPNTDFQFLIKKGAPKIEKLEDLKDKTVAVNKGSAYERGRATLKVRSARSRPRHPDRRGAGGAGWARRRQCRRQHRHRLGGEEQPASSNCHISIRRPRLGGADARAIPPPYAIRSTLIAIECMKLDGTMAKMHEKWFGIPPAPGSAATVFPGYGVPDMPGYDPTPHTPSCS